MKPGPIRTSFGEFSGIALPDEINSTQNELFVKFVSDPGHMRNYYGFEAIFNAKTKSLK